MTQMTILHEGQTKSLSASPARNRMWEFLFSGTLSDRSQGCMPRKLTMLLTASVGLQSSSQRPQQVKQLNECIANLGLLLFPSDSFFFFFNECTELPSSVLTEASAKVSSFSNSSPTSSHAAAKLGLSTFCMWSATVTSRSSSCQPGWGGQYKGTSII